MFRTKVERFNGACYGILNKISFASNNNGLIIETTWMNKKDEKVIIFFMYGLNLAMCNNMTS